MISDDSAAIYQVKAEENLHFLKDKDQPTVSVHLYKVVCRMHYSACTYQWAPT